MKFVQFLPAENTSAAFYENKDRYEATHSDLSYRDFLMQLAAKEVANEKTGGYFKFGPYWWALKAVLSAGGYHYGSHMDGLVASAYCVKDENGNIDDLLTITAAFAFRDHYLETYFIGTNQFELFDDDQFYILEDPDISEA